MNVFLDTSIVNRILDLQDTRSDKEWEQVRNTRELERRRKLTPDEKILADAAFNERVDILLTTDRKLARKFPLLRGVRVMLPCDLWASWRGHEDC